MKNGSIFGLKSARMMGFKSARLLNYCLFGYFIIPYLILFRYFNFSFDFDFNELAWVLKNSATQSAIASLVVVIMSIPMSQGLFLLPKRIQQVFKHLLIIPQILPALYSVLIAFSLLNPFPMGTIGVIFLFILINLGFATLLTYSATQDKLSNFAVVSEVYALRRFEFYTKVYFPLIKNDLSVIFFTIFIFCFTSFSIPLLAGGGKSVNLEVLIYEKIFIEHNLSSAFGLCLLQTVFVFCLSFLMFKRKKTNSENFISGQYLESSFGFLIICIYLFFYIGGYLLGIVRSFHYFDFVLKYLSELISVTLFTTKAIIYYLLLNVVLLISWLVNYLNTRKFNLAVNLMSNSTVLIGFSFYLILPLTSDYDIFKIIFASSVLFFPSFFKVFLQKSIENLDSQITISQVYGLSKLVIIGEIILKQISRSVMLWISFLVICFVSEYAILKSLGIQTQTLGLLTQDYLSSYRLPVSYLMSFYILVYWALITVLIYYILRAGYGFYKKLIY